MKSYLEFERDIKGLEEELEKLRDPFNKEGLSEVETKKITQIQKEIEEKLNGANSQLIALKKDYNDIKKSVENTLDVTFNKNIPEIREKYLEVTKPLEYYEELFNKKLTEALND